MSEEDVEIRPINLEDTWQIAKIQTHALKAAWHRVVSDDVVNALSISEAAAYWSQRLINPEHPALALERSGNLLGFISFGSSLDQDLDTNVDGEIFGLFVYPEYWGRGIGRRLMRCALEGFERRGTYGVAQWVLEDDPHARLFLEKLGFFIDGQTRFDTRSDGSTLKQIRYRKELSSRVGAWTTWTHDLRTFLGRIGNWNA